jgi:hypothetical protein
MLVEAQDEGLPQTSDLRAKYHAALVSVGLGPLDLVKAEFVFANGEMLFGEDHCCHEGSVMRKQKRLKLERGRC